MQNFQNFEREWTQPRDAATRQERGRGQHLLRDALLCGVEGAQLLCWGGREGKRSIAIFAPGIAAGGGRKKDLSVLHEILLSGSALEYGETSLSWSMKKGKSGAIDCIIVTTRTELLTVLSWVKHGREYKI